MMEHKKTAAPGEYKPDAAALDHNLILVVKFGCTKTGAASYLPHSFIVTEYG